MSVHAQPAPSCQRMDDYAAQDQGEEGGVLAVGGLHIAQLYPVPLEFGKSLSCDVLRVNSYSYIYVHVLAFFQNLESEFFSSVRKFNIKLVHVLTLFVMSVVNSVCVMCYICGAISQSQIS